MSNVIQRIDQLIEEKSLLKHPFYQQWTEGQLKLESLAGYSKEYYQLVKAVPEYVGMIQSASPNDQKDEIQTNKQEEEEHIEPWERFASSLGIKEEDIRSYQGLEKTRQAVEELYNLMGSFETGAAAMYAYEKQIPKISNTKMEGLEEFYGIKSKDATEYFRIHSEVDIRHAKVWQNILENTPPEMEDKIVDTASRSLDAQNKLLDSCYEAYCQ